VLFEKLGGVEEFFVNLGHWRAIDIVGMGYLLYPATGMVTTASLILFVRAIRTNGKLLWPGIVFIICLLPIVATGFRLGVAIALIQLLGVWHYAYRRLTLRTIAALLIPAYIFMVVYGAIRSNVQGQGLTAAALQLTDDPNETYFSVLR